MNLKLEIYRPSNESPLPLWAVDLPGYSGEIKLYGVHVNEIVYSFQDMPIVLRPDDNLAIGVSRNPDPYQMIANELGITRAEVKARLSKEVPPSYFTYLAKINVKANLNRENLRQLISKVIREHFEVVDLRVEVR